MNYLQLFQSIFFSDSYGIKGAICIKELSRGESLRLLADVDGHSFSVNSGFYGCVFLISDFGRINDFLMTSLNKDLEFFENWFDPINQC